MQPQKLILMFNICRKEKCWCWAFPNLVSSITTNSVQQHLAALGTTVAVARAIKQTLRKQRENLWRKGNRGILSTFTINSLPSLASQFLNLNQDCQIMLQTRNSMPDGKLARVKS